MEQSFIEYSLGKDASSAVLWVYPVRKPRGKAIIMCPGTEVCREPVKGKGGY